MSDVKQANAWMASGRVGAGFGVTDWKGAKLLSSICCHWIDWGDGDGHLKVTEVCCWETLHLGLVDSKLLVPFSLEMTGRN